MEAENLRTAIITTAARFDLFDFPLTDFELWQFLPEKISYLELRRNLIETKPLESESGFFFLAGRKEIVNLRLRRFRDATDKITTARRRLRVISWIPWIRLITFANIIGPHNLKRESDTDLFIITKKNRIWLVKFIATSIIALLNLRPTPKHSANRLCLSFLADDSALDLKQCLFNQDDWYFAYWLVGLQPLFGSIKAYEELIAANSWINEMLPNWQIASGAPRRRFNENYRSAHSLGIWNFFEKLSKIFNLFLMSPTLKRLANEGTGVIISDHLLKLHTGDRRGQLFEAAELKAKQCI